MGRGISRVDTARVQQHAIVIDAASGALYFKGRRTPRALPHTVARARAMRARGDRTAPLLTSGARLNLVIDMSMREMRIELLGEATEGGGPLLQHVVESSLEVDELPSEVAVCVALGPGRGPSAARLVGSMLEPVHTHDHSKTVKDLWDSSNVQRPLCIHESGGSPRGLHTGAASRRLQQLAGHNAALAEAFAVSFEMASDAAGWGGGWGG